MWSHWSEASDTDKRFTSVEQVMKNLRTIYEKIVKKSRTNCQQVVNKSFENNEQFMSKFQIMSK